MTCKWLSGDFSEVCANGDCPVCADFCPCVRYPEICRHSEDAEPLRPYGAPPLGASAEAGEAFGTEGDAGG